LNAKPRNRWPISVGQLELLYLLANSKHTASIYSG
jgi:hypothetical protein